jgi:hypothetical protein
LKSPSIPLLVLGFLVFYSFEGFSQADRSSDSLHTFTQSKISAELIGLRFQKEKARSKRNTMVFAAALNYSFYLTSGRIISKFGHSFDFTVSTGRRYYYRLFPSSIARKQNIGNFIGTDIGFSTGSLISKALLHEPTVFIHPYWGIQRKFAKRGSFELGLGIAGNYRINSADSWFDISPMLNLQVGWIIHRKIR